MAIQQLLQTYRDPDVEEQMQMLAAKRLAAQSTPEAIAKREAEAKKTASVDALTQQILGQKTTDKWSGEGYGGAEANAKAMAKLLADAGITDIKQFGKVDKYEPVEAMGHIFNGKSVQNPSKGVYYEEIPEYDSENGVTYRRRDLTPEEAAQVKTIYGKPVGQGSEGETVYQTLSDSEIVMRDGVPMYIAGQTFGNKETGQAINRGSGRWERQGGEGLFSGTGEGKGNTAFRVDFTPDGTPVFYTTQGTSNDLALLMQDLGPVGSIAANYLAFKFGGPAGVAALNAAQGKSAEDVAKSALLAYAGGEFSKAVSPYIPTPDTPIDFVGGTPESINDAINANFVKDLKAAGVGNVSEFINNVGGNAGSFIPSEAPVVASPVETVQVSAPSAPTVAPTLSDVISSIVTQQPVVTPTEVTAPIETVQVAATQTPVPTTLGDVISSIAQTQVTPEMVVTGEAPKPVEPEKPVIPLLSPTEMVVTGDRPITNQKPSTITDEVTPAPIIVPSKPIDTSLPDKKYTTAEIVDMVRLGLFGASVLGAANADTGPTQYDIVPVPENWKSPVYQKDLPSTAPTQLPPIDFGTRDLLKGTQWEKLLNPSYGQVPAPVQFNQPSDMSYDRLMSILGSGRDTLPSQALSINDVISGIQNQYGQTPTSTMG